MSGLLELLIWLIVFGIVFGIAYAIVGWLAVPEPFRRIILLVIGGIGLIILLEKLIPLLGHFA